MDQGVFGRYSVFGGRARRRRRHVLLLVVAVFASSSSSSLAFQQVISSTGPLSNIYLQDGLACNATHVGDTSPEFFGGTNPGACGTFLSTGGTSYGPSVGPSSTPYTPVSQTSVMGAGTIGSPYRVVTVVAVGGTGLRITQTDSYVVGEEEYRTDIAVANSTGAPIGATVYHAGDCYLQNSDIGYGYHDVTTAGIYCTANPNNSPPARIVGFRPLSGGSSYEEGRYSAVWRSITGAGDRFTNTCDCSIQEDNGAGLSWPIIVPGNGSARISLATRFSPSGAVSGGPPPPPVLGKAVDVMPVSGRVSIRLPRGARLAAGGSVFGSAVIKGNAFVPLTQARQIPVGSELNTRSGTVRLVSASGRRNVLFSGDFGGAFFKVSQSRDRRRLGLTTLTLDDRALPGGGSARCATGKAGDRATVARSLPRSILQRIRSRTHGRYRVNGHSSAATTHGTVWDTIDRCDGTLTVVHRGTVSVTDFRLRRTVLVTAGHSYLAKA